MNFKPTKGLQIPPYVKWLGVALAVILLCLFVVYILAFNWLPTLGNQVAFYMYVFVFLLMPTVIVIFVISWGISLIYARNKMRRSSLTLPHSPNPYDDETFVMWKNVE